MMWRVLSVLLLFVGFLALRFAAMLCMCCESADDKGSSVMVDQVPAVSEAVPVFKDKPKVESTAWSIQIPIKKGVAPSLGLELDGIDPKGWTIISIGDGLIQEFNVAHPDLALRAFDRIEAVNGVSDDLSKAMAEAFENPKLGMASLRICRPKVIDVLIAKKGEPLGVKLNFTASSAGILLQEVYPEGMIAKWNEKNPLTPIKPCDRLGAVNGAVIKGGSHEGSGRDKTMSRSQSGEETIVMDGNILIPLRRGDTAGMQATAGGHVIGEVESHVRGRAEEIVTEKAAISLFNRRGNGHHAEEGAGTHVDDLPLQPLAEIAGLWKLLGAWT
eukprot:s2318_g5.t1